MAKQKKAEDISYIFDSQRAYKLIQMIAEMEDSEGFEQILMELRPSLKI